MIVGKNTRVCTITMDAKTYDINPGETYSFEIESEGKLFTWTGARADFSEDGSTAEFNWKGGKNGVLVGANANLMRRLR